MSSRMGKDDLSSRRLARKLLFWILLLALVARLGAMIILQSWEVEESSRFGFRDGEIGEALATGQGFSWPADGSYNPKKSTTPTSWQAPVYPFIMAAFFKLFGVFSQESRLALILFQILISLLLCWLLFVSGKLIFNPWTGLLAALIFAFYPPALHLTIEKVCSSSLFVLLLILFVVLCIRLDEKLDIKTSILAGFIFGTAALTDPVIFAFFPFALAWLSAGRASELKQRLPVVFLVVLTVCITIAPWQIRNYLVFDQVFLIKSNFSRELFMGNFDSSTAHLEEQRYRSEMDEGETDKVYWAKSLDAILAQPFQFTASIYERFKFYWTQLPRPSGISDGVRGSAGVGGFSGLKELLTGAAYLFILLSGLAGICLGVAKGRGAFLLFLAIASMPVPYYLTWFTRFRYRFPTEVILIVFAGLALYELADFTVKRLQARGH